MDDINSKVFHTALCEKCVEVKPTGLTSQLYQKWLDNIGQREALELSISTLTLDLNTKGDLSVIRARSNFQR